jgi:hypothetical protein
MSEPMSPWNMSRQVTYQYKRSQRIYVSDDFGEPVYKTQGFKPVQEVLLQEQVYLVIVVNLNLTLLRMVYPVMTSILEGG